MYALIITVTQQDGQPVAVVEGLQAEFGPEGGTIGRASGSTLLLPDPDRVISRTHARIEMEGGAFVVRDQGTASPVVVNGQALGKGRSIRVGPGDAITIGRYYLAVSDNAPAPDMDATAPLAIFADAAATPPEISMSGTMLSWSESGGAGVADAIRTVSIPSPAHADVPHAGVASELAAVVAPATAAMRSNTATAPPSGVPAPTASATTVTAPAPTSVAQASTASATAATAPASAAHAATASATAATAPAPATSVPTASAAARMEPAPATSVPTASAAARMDPATATNEDLLHALLEGAGVSHLAIPGGLTPEFMQSLGQMLRETIRGLLDLLAARAMAKREVRADATIIVAQDNNPLKFSPSVEAAIAHLLMPRGMGFMSPLRAVTDAHDSLRSHQLAFMAGMQAALATVLKRLDPKALEQRAGQPSLVGSFVPGAHKARLWDEYTALHAAILRDADADFQSLFGREFLSAYQTQVSRLREQTGSHSGT
ncbi:MAG: type VI secretion system-associated FHA domain protein TagH [Betaproteobacteria bacterium]